jgi:flavin-dependent dehydrogenase
MKDYLVVGFGLAGLAFTSVLERKGKSFDIIDNNNNATHRVVGGMYNPIILKRFTPAWKADEMWLKSIQSYHWFEKKFNTTYVYPFQIYRILQSLEEQNNWSVASDKVVMRDYMNPTIKMENYKGIEAPFGFGELDKVGRVDGEQILSDYKKELSTKELFNQENFTYEDIVLHNDTVEYHGQQYKHIVFSEGSNIVYNPYFNYLPMKEAKGEMLVIEIPDLSFTKAIKSSCFMVPLGKQKFIVGATYNWEDKSGELTLKGKSELEKKLQSFLKVPYAILDYKAGIRPTVLDRRPLLGQHPKHDKLWVLNGLGTRGIIYAPALAELLFDAIENGAELNNELNINRFNTLLN